MDVRNAAAFLPTLRPNGPAALAFCGRAAEELGENDGSVPDDVAVSGVALVDDMDRAAIVSTFRAAAPDAWDRVAALADHAACELVGSAVRGAICD
ncbi:MAG TPA: hypothetical protein VMJ49_12335, partial [Gaiellaceae bacterium]|nr:hypothetical protein [Gaiellaceae bacterium]